MSMDMKIVLSINAGSSSVKTSVYSVISRGEPTLLAEAQVSGLTAPHPRLTYSRGGETVVEHREVPTAAHNQDEAFKLILDTFLDDIGLPQVSQKDDFGVTCHRVVHGGGYTSPKVISSDTIHHIEDLSNLAPLHNSSALDIIRSCLNELPQATHVAHFDSAFHPTIPEYIRTYPIEPDTARRNHLRKYGFHGLSYQFIVGSVAKFLGKERESLNIIALHLGSGASVCAVKDGQSLDTSMGLTPLAGLPGATRSGSVDPSLIFHFASDTGRLAPASTRDLHISKAEEILNKQSGWKALAGTADFGDVVASDEPKSKFAFDLFVDRVCGYVGAYFVALEGRVDALVFAGGIGERSDKVRKQVVCQAACLGFELDEDNNQKVVSGRDTVLDIGRQGARHRTLVCRTDEQLEMARVCANNDELWQ